MEARIVLLGTAVTLILSFGTATFAADEVLAGKCGKARWAVKTGTDSDAGKVDLSKAVTTTVPEMYAWPAPAQLPPKNRVQPYETTVYTVSATIVETFNSEDSDYHLLVKDAAGNALVTEVPDPACVGASSPFLEKIKAARKAVDAHLSMGSTGSSHSVNIPVIVTGVGMFDDKHGVPGEAPNGIEIHPVLDIQFKSIDDAYELNTPVPIPEFHQVTDNLYRGGHPDTAGLDYVKGLGVHTVIDLEDKPQVMQQEKQYASKIGLKWISEPLSASVYPDEKEVNETLGYLQDSSRFPIFIHCKHGQDRTGLIMGLYRVFVQKWPAAQAYQEMLQYGFHPEYKPLDQYFRDKTGYTGGFEQSFAFGANW